MSELILDAGREYLADLKALHLDIQKLQQENAKLLDEVTARRFTDERTDKLLDELGQEIAVWIDWATSLFGGGTDEQGWPPGTELLDAVKARDKRLREALEEIQGYGEVEVNPQHDWDVGNDLNACVRIARKALDNKAEIINKAE